ncbi:MAG: radical SAM protein [Candidatus Helarchaeota archaeon]
MRSNTNRFFIYNSVIYVSIFLFLIKKIIFTHKCNNICAHCYNESNPDGVIITKSEIDKVIEHLTPYRFRRISLSGGEPFYNENKTILYYLLQKLREKYELKTDIAIQTNGDYITEEIIDELREFKVTRLDISSFDAFHKHVNGITGEEKKRKTQYTFY